MGLMNWNADGRVTSGDDPCTTGINLVGLYSRHRSAFELIHLRSLGRRGCVSLL